MIRSVCCVSLFLKYTILADYSLLAREKKIGKICTYTVFQSNEGSVEKCTDSSQVSLLAFRPINKTKSEAFVFIGLSTKAGPCEPVPMHRLTRAIAA